MKDIGSDYRDFILMQFLRTCDSCVFGVSSEKKGECVHFRNLADSLEFSTLPLTCSPTVRVLTLMKREAGRYSTLAVQRADKARFLRAHSFFKDSS